MHVVTALNPLAACPMRGPSVDTAGSLAYQIFPAAGAIDIAVTVLALRASH